MKRLPLATLPILLLPSLVLWLPSAALARYCVYVTDRATNTIAVVDTELGGIATRIAVAANPVSIDVSPSGDRIFVGSRSPHPGRVTIIDVQSNSPLRSYATPEFAQFDEIATSVDGEDLYLLQRNGNAGALFVSGILDGALRQSTVVGGGSAIALDPTMPAVLGLAVSKESFRGVAWLDLELGEVIAEIDVGSTVRDLAVTPDGGWLLGPNDAQPGALFVANNDTRTEAFRLALKDFPHSVAVLPDGSKAFVSHRTPGGTPPERTELTVIDLPSFRVRSGALVGPDPRRLVTSPDGAIVVSANRGNPDNPGSISIVDAGTEQLLDSILIGEPEGLAVLDGAGGCVSASVTVPPTWTEVIPSDATPTPTPGATRVPTATWTWSFTPTFSPTRTPTPDPTACQETPCPTPSSCGGDCDGDRRVRVSELVGAVQISLGRALVETCLAADTDGGGSVSIAELVSAVGHALEGCPTGER